MSPLTKAGVLCGLVLGGEELLREGCLPDARPAEHEDAIGGRALSARVAAVQGDAAV